MHIIIKEVKRLPHSKLLETEYSASVKVSTISCTSNLWLATLLSKDIPVACVNNSSVFDYDNYLFITLFLITIVQLKWHLLGMSNNTKTLRPEASVLFVLGCVFTKAALKL